MLTFEEGTTNDFVVSGENNLALLSDLPALSQSSRSVIERQRGEMQFLSDEGIPTNETLWVGQPRQLQFQFYCRQAIAQLDGVVSVDRFDSEIGENNQLTYSAQITTIYGQEGINGNL